MGTKKALARKEGDITAAFEADKMLCRIGDMLRCRQGAVSLFPEASHDGGRGWLPYVPFLTPKSGESPRAPQDQAFRREAEAE